MTCSRCGHTSPNPSCYVCWTEPEDDQEPDMDDEVKASPPRSVRYPLIHAPEKEELTLYLSTKHSTP